MTRLLCNTVLLSSVLALASTFVPASAQVYDAANDFSTAGNPNGIWSYGWTSTLGSTFSLDTLASSSSEGFPTQIDVFDNAAGQTNNGIFPYISHNDTNTNVATGTQRWQPNQILTHPGPGGEYAVVRWTAPSAGTWSLNSVFDGQDIEGTTTDVHVLQNGTVLFDGSVSGYLDASSFSQTIVTKSGDVLDFAVGYGSNNSYYNDSTGVSATIQPLAAPEPGTFGLLTATAIFGGGLALRRRRK